MDWAPISIRLRGNVTIEQKGTQLAINPGHLGLLGWLGFPGRKSKWVFA